MSRQINALLSRWENQDGDCADVDMQLSLSFAMGAGRVAGTLPDVGTSAEMLERTLRRQLKKISDEWGRDQLRDCIMDVVELREKLLTIAPARTKRAPSRARVGGRSPVAASARQRR